MRGNARGGPREPEVRGGDPTPPRVPLRDGRPLRPCQTVARNEQRSLRRPRAHALRSVLRPRSRHRVSRRQPRCGRVEPAQRVSSARGDGRARVPVEMAASLGQWFSNKVATRRPMTCQDQRPTGCEQRCAVADPLARRSRARPSEAAAFEEAEKLAREAVRRRRVD